MFEIDFQSRLFRALSALTAIAVLAAVSLPLSDASGIMSSDCDDGCDEDCESACGCTGCPLPTVAIGAVQSDHAPSLSVLPLRLTTVRAEVEQEWFDSIDHPPQVPLQYSLLLLDRS